MKIANAIAALLLACAAAGQTRWSAQPSRLASFLAATKGAIVRQSAVGELSGFGGPDLSNAGNRSARAKFFAVVARDPRDPSVELTGVRVNLTGEVGGRTTKQVVYLDGDGLEPFESALEYVAVERPRPASTSRDPGRRYRGITIGARNGIGPGVSPLEAGWWVGPGGAGLVIQTPATLRSYYFPGIPVERLVEIVAAARTYIRTHSHPTPRAPDTAE